ncbi:glucokinase [Lachnospiraceae bacterium XBB1006]|nr:glucokinase [Lachnospiraceae bacterium XBB1006]
MVGYGVDIGGTFCKLGLFREDGTLVENWQIPSRREDLGAEIISDVAASICENMRKHGFTGKEVAGIAVGVPGPVTKDGVVGRVTNIGWERKDVAGELKELTGIPVKVANDANVAALGELKYGRGKGKDSLVLLTLGTGVGGGIVLDGRIVYGANGGAGEIGHCKVNPKEQAVCGCGKRGCLEQYASATGMVRMAHAFLEESEEESSLRNQSFSAKEIVEAAKHGDAVANRVVQKAGDYLGLALANVGATLDPEILVIGGGVSAAGDILLDAVRESYKTQTFHACEKTPIELAVLGNQAGIYGCMAMIF